MQDKDADGLKASSLQGRGVSQAHQFCRYNWWCLRYCLQKDLAAGWNTYKDPQISHSSHYKKIMSFLLTASLHTWKIPKSLCRKLQVALSHYGSCPWISTLMEQNQRRNGTCKSLRAPMLQMEIVRGIWKHVFNIQQKKKKRLLRRPAGWTGRCEWQALDFPVAKVWTIFDGQEEFHAQHDMFFFMGPATKKQQMNLLKRGFAPEKSRQSIGKTIYPKTFLANTRFQAVLCIWKRLANAGWLFLRNFWNEKNLVPPRIPVSVRVPGEEQPFDARLFEATSSQLVLEQDWGSAQTSLNQVGSHQIGVHQVDPKNGRQEMLEIWLEAKLRLMDWAHSFTSRPCGTVGWNSGGDGAGGYTMLVLVLVF